ncbi:MAG: hypothetical protein ACI80V_003285 [Rhodothermales bacterium]
MDNLFIIAIVAYWILQAIASKKKRDRENQEALESDEPLNEFDQALSEIREALGGTPAPGPEPAPGAAPRAAPPPSVPSGAGPSIPDRRATAPTRISTAAKSATRGPSTLDSAPVAAPRAPAKAPKPSDEFHQVNPGGTDWHSDFKTFGSEWKSSGAPSSEWRTPKAKPAPVKRVDENAFEASGPEFRDALVGHDHQGRPKSIQAPAPSSRRFSSPEAVREAIIAREVLGPPKSKRGPGR